MEIFRTLIPTTEYVALARTLCEVLGGLSGAGMFTTPLVNSEGVVTHYISSGYISEEFSQVLSDPNILFAMCQQVEISMTLEDCENIIETSDISEEGAFEAMERMGLIISE